MFGLPDLRSARRGLALLAVALPATAGSAPAVELAVTVDGVRNDRGHVLVAVCTPTTFLGPECPYGASAPAAPGEVLVVVRDVPPGTYAIQVFHDENDNREVDRGLLGVPLEGVGFGNDAPMRLGPPEFEAAALSLAGERAAARVTLRHFDD